MFYGQRQRETSAELRAEGQDTCTQAFPIPQAKIYQEDKKGGWTVMEHHHSKVAQLKQQIVEEYEAGKRGLEGLALGAAQHDFITQRVENMSRCQMQLIALVGNEQASKILTEVGL